MNTRLKGVVLAWLLAWVVPMSSHPVEDNGVMPLDENRRPKERQLLHIPDVGDFQILKCDFHMHTVFSDGLVWPTIRVQEAWMEGLDAICITDHIEYQPHKADIPSNFNRSYELAEQEAGEANLLLIMGSELTRHTPPGHFNAIFITDASDFVGEKGLELDELAIEKAAGQNAFIFWNHPGWKADSIAGSYEWIPFVDKLRQENKLHGIEVINGFDFHRKALDWALEKGLTVLGTSDIHNLIENEYDTQHGVRRSMTLLFAKDRSVEGVREALEAGRTVAWSTKYLAGKEEWVRALYDASVTVGAIHATDHHGIAYAEITNNSDLYFELERVDTAADEWPETISLNPRTSQLLEFAGSGSGTARYAVTNAFIGGDRNLVVDISLSH